MYIKRQDINNMAELSIIIPVHNSEKYLRKCMESVYAQRYRDFEVILVENGSVDGSRALCEELAGIYPSVKTVYLNESGPSVARNAGVKAATSEFVGFVDSDDTIDPDTYGHVVELAKRESLDIVVWNFVKKYDYRGDRNEYPGTGSVDMMPSKDLLKLNFLEKIPLSVCTMLCRRTVFEEVEFPVGRYYEDTATSWRLILNSDRCAYVDTPYYHYYRHEGSIVHTASFDVHYGHVLADMERIDYLISSKEYDIQEKVVLAHKTLGQFYSRFAKMLRLVSTEREKQICIGCREWALAIPPCYTVRRKYRLIRKLVHNWWQLYTVLKCGEILRK